MKKSIIRTLKGELHILEMSQETELMLVQPGQGKKRIDRVLVDILKDDLYTLWGRGFSLNLVGGKTVKRKEGPANPIVRNKSVEFAGEDSRNAKIARPYYKKATITIEIEE